MGILIDSSAFIAVERSGDKLESLLVDFEREPLAIAAITASELLHGVLRADSPLRRKRREQFVEEVFARFPVLAFDLEVARTYSQLWVDLKATGAFIAPHDLMIAATALCYDLQLLTHNLRHFARIERLRLVAT